jgi:hypothetical protein
MPATLCVCVYVSACNQFCLQNDPWGAARYYAEAEKQEELEESKAADIQVRSDTAQPER